MQQIDIKFSVYYVEEIVIFRFCLVTNVNKVLRMKGQKTQTMEFIRTSQALQRVF